MESNGHADRLRLRCAISGCTVAPKAAKYLMCSWHWRLVPEPLQKTIWRLYRDGVTPYPGLEEACTSAIEQVEDALDARRRGAGDGGTLY